MNVSEAIALKIPTVDSAEWAYITGMDPYKDIVESARYSKTSEFHNRYGSS